MSVKLHPEKGLPKVGERVIEKNWLFAILLEIIRIYSFSVGELFEKNWLSAILLEIIRIYSFSVGE